MPSPPAHRCPSSIPLFLHLQRPCPFNSAWPPECCEGVGTSNGLARYLSQLMCCYLLSASVLRSWRAFQCPCLSRVINLAVLAFQPHDTVTVNLIADPAELRGAGKAATPVGPTLALGPTPRAARRGKECHGRTQIRSPCFSGLHTAASDAA